MKGLIVCTLSFAFSALCLSEATGQVQTGVWRTPAGNTDYHHFTRDNATGAAVYINQVGSGPILRLSSGENTANQGVKLTVQHDGSIGIGTTAPLSKLHINSTESNAFRVYREGQSDKYLDIWHGTAGAVIDAINTNTGILYLGYRNPVNVILANRGGSVGIGTTNINGWKLAVNGNIRAKEIKVETGWSDFVFEEDYALPTLEEVEQHIKEKGHLKDIPSAKEVEENGIFLGEMDAKLLQKIEELTLYTIEQEKRIRELEKQNSLLIKLQEEVKALKEK